MKTKINTIVILIFSLLLLLLLLLMPDKVIESMTFSIDIW